LRIARTVSLVLILALTAAACSSGASSGPDGKLIIYSGRSESLVGPILTDFSTSTGIEIEVKYGDTSELAATILEEGAKSPADIFFAQDGGALGAVESAGLFRELPAEVLNKVPANFRSVAGGWIGVTGRVRIIGYNPTTTPPAAVPKDVDSLTDPKWKDQVAWAPTNGSFQAFVTAMRVQRGDDATKLWLQKMVDNGARAYPKNSAIAEAVNNTEVALGLLNHYYPLELASEVPDAEIQIQFVSNDVGGLANVAGVGVLESSKEEEVLKLVEYLLETETQERFVEDTFEFPLIEGVEGPEGLPSLDELQPPSIDLNDLDDLQGTLDMLAEVGLL
jgi:iron(III) transport system substrate-binding protein